MSSDFLDISVGARSIPSGSVKSEARETLSDFLRREINGGAAQTWSLKVGLHPQDVRRALHGATGMSLDKLQTFADALSVEPWQLLFPGFERNAKDFPTFSVEAVDLAQRIDQIGDEAQRRRVVAALVNVIETLTSSPSDAPARPTQSENDTTQRRAARL